MAISKIQVEEGKPKFAFSSMKGWGYKWKGRIIGKRREGLRKDARQTGES